jgi:hypothetical protein
MKLMGIEFDESLFKKRKGFRNIVIDGQMFQFNWADNPDGPCLILYGIDQKKLEIPHSVWDNDRDHSQTYLSAPTNTNYHTWHGKHKKGACFGSWGKPEAAELYRKWKKLNEI